MRKRNRGTPKNISGPGNVVNRTANRLDDTPERVGDPKWPISETESSVLETGFLVAHTRWRLPETEPSVFPTRRRLGEAEPPVLDTRGRLREIGAALLETRRRLGETEGSLVLREYRLRRGEPSAHWAGVAQGRSGCRFAGTPPPVPALSWTAVDCAAGHQGRGRSMGEGAMKAIEELVQGMAQGREWSLMGDADAVRGLLERVYDERYGSPQGSLSATSEPSEEG